MEGDLHTKLTESRHQLILGRQIEESLRDQQSQGEKEWSKEKDVSTEDLRKTLQRYRALFDRLLSL